ncbi:MAG: Na+/H+ antiporter NhaA [Bacteroidales bacterium]
MSDLLYSFKSMLRNYVNSSFILIFVTMLALVCANSPLSEDYFGLWNKEVHLQIGDFNLFGHNGHAMTLMDVINDFLMAIFFFSVGLEIKREILVGELSSMKKALLPIIGAIGGMIIPVLIFFLFTNEGLGVRGSAIPMATDIAFSLGVLSMLGKRVPLGLKIFLAALAVADDLGGIIVIAMFYSGHLDITYLLYAAFLVMVLGAGAYYGVRTKIFYCSIGIFIWYLFLNSGIHATIAGVVVAFCVPARPATTSRRYIERIRENISKFPKTPEHLGEIHILTNEQIALLKSVESASDHVISPLQDLEDTLAPLISMYIIPLFAFANAGINFEGMSFMDLFKGVGLSVFTGLFFGKMIGIYLFSWVAIKLKVVDMPAGADWKMFAGVAMLGGIGFTVSMFIATLSYAGAGAEGMALLNQAKLGILVGSLCAGTAGYMMLNKFLPKEALYAPEMEPAEVMA